MPKRFCSVTSCGAEAERGHSKCARHGAADRQRTQAAYDQQRPSAGDRGYGADWREATADFRKAHPICQEPGCGRRTAAVDHIQSVASAPHRRLDPSNWRALCWHHHREKTAGEKREGLTRSK